MDFKKILKISRPRFWLYLAGPFLLGYFYGLQNIADISWQFVYTLFFFLVPANIYLYGINDYADRDTDAFNKKKSQKEHRLQNKETKSLMMWLAVSLLFLIPIIFWSTTGGIIILAIWLALSTMYSMPPRFKAIPFIDFMSNILYVMPGFYAYFELTGSHPSPLIIIASFLWVWAMHLYSAIPDIKADKKANLKTAATVMGSKLSIWLCTLFWFIFAVIVSFKAFPLGLITLIYPALGIYTALNLKKIDNIYWYYPYVTGFIGFLGFVHAALLLFGYL
ncbi:MAG: prenyltransferase [Candidatus Woesearchaeota archaeon]